VPRDEGFGAVEEDSQNGQELTNPHGIKRFQCFAGWPGAEVSILVQGKTLEDSSVVRPPSFPPPTCRSRKTADSSRKPEILNPPPIGQFVEFLLRTHKTKWSRSWRTPTVNWRMCRDSPVTNLLIATCQEIRKLLCWKRWT
jgi:hypothetical protein